MENLKFNSVDEVQEMIRRLKTVEENLLTNGSNAQTESSDPSNPTNSIMNGKKNVDLDLDDPYRVLETHELIDYTKLCNGPQDIWLIPDSAIARYVSNSARIFVPEEDKSWLDENLIKSRTKFFKYYTSLIKERDDRNNAVYCTPTSTPVKVRRNSSYTVRNGPLNICSPISPVSPSLETSAENNTMYYTAQQSIFERDSSFYDTYCRVNAASTPKGYIETPKATDGPHSKLIRKDTFVPEKSRISVAENFEKMINNHLASKSPCPTNLNSTFTQSNSEIGSNNSGSSTSLNNSSAMDMDEIESIAKIQEQSLNMVRVNPAPAPLERRTTRVVESRDYVEVNVRPQYNRASSNDTYSVGDSNPTSETSSVTSSPRDFQSCEDIQSASDTMRRSMPNLSFIKNNRNQSTINKSSLSKSPKYFSSDIKIDKSNNQNIRSMKPVQMESGEHPSRALAQSTTGGNKEKPRLTRGNTFNKPSGSLNGDALNNVEIYNDGDDGDKYRYNTIVKQSHQSRGMLPQFSSGSSEGISVPKHGTGTFTRKVHSNPNDIYNPGVNTTFSKSSGGARTSQAVGSKIPAPGSMNSRLRTLHPHDSRMSKRDQQDYDDSTF